MWPKRIKQRGKKVYQMAKRLTKKRRKSIRAGLTYLMIISVLSLAAYGYKYINSYFQDNLAAFKLVDIDIKGNHILSRTDILKLCGLPKGETQLLHLRPSEVVKNLIRSPYIKSAGAVRSLPATLRIVVEERKPVAFIYGRGLNLIDEEGVLMPIPKNHLNWNLPFITGVNETLGTLGEKTVSRRALLGAEILVYMRWMKSPLSEVISELNLSRKNDLRLRLIQGGASVRFDRKNYQENLFLLSQYFKKYLDWSRLAAYDYFDVRYNDQLIIKEKRG